MESMSFDMAHMMAENDRLQARSKRDYTASLSQHMMDQEQELRELRQRRANNMSATRQLNLERQKSKLFKRQVEELRNAIKINWGQDTLELAEAGATVPHFQAELECLARSLEEAEEEILRLRSIVCPPKPMVRGHYDMRLRFSIMKLIGIANVCHTRVPAVLDIMSEYFGIQRPGRWREVLVSVVNGVRTYKKAWLVWRPSASTCENIRSVPHTLKLHIHFASI